MKRISDVEFDGMLEDVLREAANPEMRTEFAGRMREQFQARMRANAFDGGLAQGDEVREDAMTSGAADVDSGVVVVEGSGRFSLASGRSGVFEELREVLRGLGTRRGLEPLALGSGSRWGSAAGVGQERRGFGPVGWAVGIHAAAALVLAFGLVSGRLQLAAPEVKQMTTLVEPMPPLRTPAKAQTMGGGGGQSSPTPAAQGRLPKFAETQIAPPKAPPLVQPKIAIEPTVVVQKDLKMAESTLPNLGMPNSPIVGTGSLGNGSGTGVGAGNGAGVGMGNGGNTGGGALRIGGGVSAPVPLSMPDPEFSEEARKAKVSGNVLVYLWVDQLGRPTHVRVLRGIGMGLDEKAIAAVREYRFKPAMRDGRPVTVEMNVEVNFQIF